MRQLLSRYLIILLMPASVACSSGDTESAGDDSGWTVENNGIALEEELYISESDDFIIGSADDVAVDLRGRMLVLDGEERHLKVLSPDGELDGTIGAPGQGPGEFRRPRQAALARGDSVYVLDVNYGQVSVFAPDHEFEYSFSVLDEAERGRHIMVPEGEAGFILAYTPMDPETEPGYAIRSVNWDGTSGDTLFTAPPPDMAVEQIGSTRHVYRLPYARRSHFAMGPDDHIHFAWSDSLRITAYDQLGEKLRTVEVPFEGVPVTQEDREREMQGLPAQGQHFVQDKIPETKPAFTSFALDDQNRYWFKRPTDDPEMVEWWIVDPDERRILTAKAPTHITFSVIRDGYAYGTKSGSDVLPAVVRYRVIE